MNLLKVVGFVSYGDVLYLMEFWDKINDWVRESGVNGKKWVIDVWERKYSNIFFGFVLNNSYYDVNIDY